jgi:hypothetical protein
MQIAARQQPTTLPGVRERWQFIEPTLKRAPFIKMVPMLVSLRHLTSALPESAGHCGPKSGERTQLRLNQACRRDQKLHLLHPRFPRRMVSDGLVVSGGEHSHRLPGIWLQRTPRSNS